MVEHNTKTNETHVFCDRCQKEILNNVYILSTGDSLCKDCFDESYEIKTVDEYIKELYSE